MAIPSPRHPEQPARVLVVEDDDTVGAFIETLLQMEGYDVLRAHDGAEALGVAASFDPDLVTLDVMMPGLDGWQVARALRADERTCLARLVMVSAIPRQELTERAGHEPVQAVLSKPFDFAALMEIIERTLAFEAA